jgi:hypothetical protein
LTFLKLCFSSSVGASAVQNLIYPESVPGIAIIEQYHINIVLKTKGCFLPEDSMAAFQKLFKLPYSKGYLKFSGLAWFVDLKQLCYL